MIHARTGPACFRMAVVAGIVALDMIGRFAGGADNAGLAMAVLAALRCALEYTAFVAAVAADPGMRTIE